MAFDDAASMSKPGGNPEDEPSALASGLRTVFLVGFMGAGKSSVGRALSLRLGWTFEDLDERIQAREGRSIQQIFQRSGEPEFRRVEHAALRELLAESDAAARVVALGGGAFVQAHNATLLEDAGVSIFLDAPVEELFRRCQGDKLERPLHRDGQHFRQLYELRRPHYMKASFRVETAGKHIEAIAAEIADILKLGIESKGR
jgi:shikimate kinase